MGLKQQGSFSIAYALTLLGVSFLFLMIISIHTYMTVRERMRDALVVAVAYGARVPDPFSIYHQTQIIRLVKTGRLEGGAEFLSPGWSLSSASVFVSQTTLTDSHAVSHAALEVDMILPVPFISAFANVPIRLSHAEIIHAL